VPTDPLVSIIVPVYNEAGTVQSVIERLLTIPLPGPREVIVVNDGSTDGTRDVLTKLDEKPTLKIVHASQNGGKGSAIRIGLTHARGSIVAIQDADLELDPAQIADLLGPIVDNQTAVVYGSRFLGGRPESPWSTVLANRVLTGITNRIYGSALTDMETCYKVMRTDVVKGLGLESPGFDIEPEITAKLLRRGYSILERPVSFKPRGRAAGKKIRWQDGVRALGTLLKYRDW
jgi:glycosyltransferase involved in cell wall biosynthesis